MTDTDNCKFCGAKIYWYKDARLPPRSFNVKDNMLHNPTCRPNEVLAHPSYKALNPCIPKQVLSGRIQDDGMGGFSPSPVNAFMVTP